MRATKFRRTRRGLLGLATVGAIMGFAPTVASATHVFPNSFAACERQDPTTGTFECTLTIVIGDGIGGGAVVRVDEDEHVGVMPIGATFATVPIRTGGTCAPTSTVAQPMLEAVSLVLTVDLRGCTIILEETLIAQPGTQLCHGLLAVVTNSYWQTAACVQLLSSLTDPTTKDQCKNGGWSEYAHLGFKNQGDCVSFVATRGKNPPGRL